MKLRFLVILSILIELSVSSFSQDFKIKLNHFILDKNDSINFYVRESWKNSTDINDEDIERYLNRASEKIQAGYMKEALVDVNKVLSLDSTVSHAHFLKGFLLFMSDSLKSAAACFTRSISLNDTIANSYFYMGEINLKLSNLNEAESFYEKALRLDNKMAGSYFGLASVSFLKNQQWKAERMLKKVIDLDPSFPLSYINLAVISFPDYNKALGYLDQAVKANPGFALVYFIRGAFHGQYGNKTQCYLDWTKAVNLEPTNGTFSLFLGLMIIYDKNFSEGFKEINRALENFHTKDLFTYLEANTGQKLVNDFLSQVITLKSDSSVLNEREKEEIIKALCYFCIREFDKAESIYAAILPFSSSPGLVNYLRGYNLEYLMNINLSLKSYKAAVMLKSYPPEAYLRGGILLNVLGRFKEAKPDLQAFLKMNDSVRLGYRALAASYIGLAQYDSSISVLDKLIFKDSSELDIYYDRAFCYNKLNRYIQAMKDCSYLLRYKPDNVQAICLLAECRFASGDTTGAFNLLDQTDKRLHMLTPDGYLLRGSINMIYTRYDSAIIDFNEVIILNPSHTDAYVYRGLCNYCKNEYSRAKNDFTQALSINANEITALYTRGLTNIKLNKSDEAYSDLKKADSLGHPLSKRAIYLYLKDYKP